MYCYNCGTKLNDTANFCTKCGIRLHSSEIDEIKNSETKNPLIVSDFSIIDKHFEKHKSDNQKMTINDVWELGKLSYLKMSSYFNSQLNYDEVKEIKSIEIVNLINYSNISQEVLESENVFNFFPFQMINDLKDSIKKNSPSILHTRPMEFTSAILFLIRGKIWTNKPILLGKIPRKGTISLRKMLGQNWWEDHTRYMNYVLLNILAYSNCNIEFGQVYSINYVSNYLINHYKDDFHPNPNESLNDYNYRVYSNALRIAENWNRSNRLNY
jgi:hypothetical protein